MNESELEIAFEMMGSRLRGFGNNKNAQCPLALWTHTRGVDKNPSLTATAGDPALFRCWSCEARGTVKKLARLFMEHSGDSRAYDYVRNIEGEQVSLWDKAICSYGDRTYVGKRIRRNNQRPIMEDDLKVFMEKVPEYAFKIGVTREQVVKWEIGYDAKLMRMIAPIRDENRKLCGVSGRDVTGQQKPKWKHYHGFRKELVLYGEHYVNPLVPRGYVVEGFTDVWHLDRYRCPNPLASMGTSLSAIQMKKLGQWFREVVFIPDCDDDGAGLRFCEEFAERLVLSSGIRAGVAGTTRNHVFMKRQRPRKWEHVDHRLQYIPAMEGKDPANLSPGDLREALNTIHWFVLKNGALEVEHA